MRTVPTRSSPNQRTRAQREIAGDWSALKGVHYHLVYALWLLLRGGADWVAFYGVTTCSPGLPALRGTSDPRVPTCMPAPGATSTSGFRSSRPPTAGRLPP